MGDWCVFEGDELLAGRVLKFSYLSGKGKARQYSLLSSPTKTPQGKKGRGIGVMCNWYSCNEYGDLTRVVKTGYYSIDHHYKFTITRPLIHDSHLSLDVSLDLILPSFLLSHMCLVYIGFVLFF